jgi:hypothetical protein
MSAEIIVYAAIAFAAVAVVILLFVAMRAFKAPTVFYASEESSDNLISKLSCPKCRSKRIRAAGRYTIGCENCGFIFSVGTVKGREAD